MPLEKSRGGVLEIILKFNIWEGGLSFNYGGGGEKKFELWGGGGV